MNPTVAGTQFKTCTTCGSTHPIEAFGTKLGKPRTQCRDCRKAYCKRYYWTDPEVSRQIDRARYAAKKAQVK